MSDNTHTPGPWHIEQATNSLIFGQAYTSYSICTEKRVEICRTNNLHPEPVSTANAFLLAASPELLTSCITVLNIAFKHEVMNWLDAPGTDSEKLEQIVNIMRDAIAKATGQS